MNIVLNSKQLVIIKAEELNNIIRYWYSQKEYLQYFKDIDHWECSKKGQLVEELIIDGNTIVKIDWPNRLKNWCHTDVYDFDTGKYLFTENETLNVDDLRSVQDNIRCQIVSVSKVRENEYAAGAKFIRLNP